MELRKATWSAALRLALVMSVVAAGAAVMLSAAGDVPRGALVAAVVLVGFVASWIQTGRVARVHHGRRVSIVTPRRSVG